MDHLIHLSHDATMNAMWLADKDIERQVAYSANLIQHSIHLITLGEHCQPSVMPLDYGDIEWVTDSVENFSWLLGYISALNSDKSDNFKWRVLRFVTLFPQRPTIYEHDTDAWRDWYRLHRVRSDWLKRSVPYWL